MNERWVPLPWLLFANVTDPWIVPYPHYLHIKLFIQLKIESCELFETFLAQYC